MENVVTELIAEVQLAQTTQQEAFYALRELGSSAAGTPPPMPTEGEDDELPTPTQPAEGEAISGGELAGAAYQAASNLSNLLTELRTVVSNTADAAALDALASSTLRDDLMDLEASSFRQSLSESSKVSDPSTADLLLVQLQLRVDGLLASAMCQVAASRAAVEGGSSCDYLGALQLLHSLADGAEAVLGVLEEAEDDTDENTSRKDLRDGVRWALCDIAAGLITAFRTVLGSAPPAAATRRIGFMSAVGFVSGEVPDESFSVGSSPSLTLTKDRRLLNLVVDALNSSQLLPAVKTRIANTIDRRPKHRGEELLTVVLLGFVGDLHGAGLRKDLLPACDMLLLSLARPLLSTPAAMLLLIGLGREVLETTDAVVDSPTANIVSSPSGLRALASVVAVGIKGQGGLGDQRADVPAHDEVAPLAALLLGAIAFGKKDAEMKPAHVLDSISSFMDALEGTPAGLGAFSSGAALLHTILVRLEFSLLASGALPPPDGSTGPASRVAGELRLGVVGSVNVTSKLVDVNVAARQHASSEAANIALSWVTTSQSGDDTPAVAALAAAVVQVLPTKSGCGPVVAVVKKGDASRPGEKSGRQRDRYRKALAGMLAPDRPHTSWLPTALIANGRVDGGAELEVKLVEERTPGGNQLQAGVPPPIAVLAAAVRSLERKSLGEPLTLGFAKRFPPEVEAALSPQDEPHVPDPHQWRPMWCIPLVPQIPSAAVGKILPHCEPSPYTPQRVRDESPFRHADPNQSCSRYRKPHCASTTGSATTPPVSPRRKRGPSPVKSRGGALTPRKVAEVVAGTAADAPATTIVFPGADQDALREALAASASTVVSLEAQRNDFQRQAADLRSELDIVQTDMVLPLQEEVQRLRRQLAAANAEVEAGKSALLVLQETVSEQQTVIAAQTALMEGMRGALAAVVPSTSPPSTPVFPPS